MSAVARAWGFWIAAMAVWEWMLRMEASSGLDYLPWVAAFVVAFSGILALLTSLPGWAGKLFSWTVAPLVVVLYGVQLVYYDIFGSLASLAFAAMGGEAITQFWPIVLEAIWRCLPRLLGLMVPWRPSICCGGRNASRRCTGRAGWEWGDAAPCCWER